MKSTEGKRIVKRAQKRWLMLAFAVPIVFMWVAFALHGVFPFGDNQILVSDAGHQYYPFLLELQTKLQTGDSLLYSWKSGLGANFWAVIAYYCASPLNLLTALVPENALLLFYTMMVTLKMGFAGLFCAVFLKGIYGRNDASIAVFGSFYGLCSYFMGYYWNIMWLDTVALLPLVTLGTYALVKEGRFKLYVSTLFLALWCNFLIGLYVCIFILFTFFALCVCLRLTGREIWRRLVKIAWCSILAICMTAVLLLPAYLALMNTARTVGNPPGLLERSARFIDIFRKMLAWNKPTWRTGAPNVYSGLPCLILSLVYFLIPEIPRRQKLCTGFMLLFLITSFSFDILEFFWNGLRRTNMLPDRFSFLFSFVLITVAFCVWQNVERISWKKLLTVAGAIVLFSAVWVVKNRVMMVAVNIGLIVAYLVVIWMFRKETLKRCAAILLCVVVAAEMLISPIIALDTVGVLEGSDYPENKKEISKLLEEIETRQDVFARVVTMPRGTLNDPILLGYRGATSFSSTINAGVAKYLYYMGYAASTRDSRYFQSYLTSPLTNAMLNMKYVIIRDGEAKDPVHLLQIGCAGDVYAYENKMSLGLGFMTGPDMALEISKDDNPFVRQNSVFAAATEMEETMYELLPISKTDHEGVQVTAMGPEKDSCSLMPGTETGTLRYTYIMPQSGLFYGYVYCSTSIKEFTVGEDTYDTSRLPYIFCAGWFEEGQEVTISLDVTEYDELQICGAVLQEDVFAEGLERLADEQMQVQQVTATTIQGTIEAKEEGYFFTSIPYEAGWSLTVDGVPTQITPCNDAFIAVENLQAGEHSISLTYRPEGFDLGLWISVAAAIVFLVVCVLDTKKRTEKK